MLGLLHRLRQRSAVPRCFGQIAGPQSVRREIPRIEPATAQRRLTIRLIDCGVRARSSTAPQRSMARKMGRFEMSARSNRSFTVVTGGPTRNTAPSPSAIVVLVRPSRMARQGRAGE